MMTLPVPSPGRDETAGMQQLGLRPPLPVYLRSLLARRDFMLALTTGQVRSRNANTGLGSLWHLLNPLTLAAAYYLVFGLVFDARDDVDNYVGFLVIGLFVFYYTQRCLTGGARTIVLNKTIIRNVNLPRAVFPLASVLAETLVHLPALGLLVVLMLATGEGPHLAWAMLVPLVVVQGAFNLGLSFWIGRLTFHYRDVQNLLPFASRLLLYVSGVFFTAQRLPEGLAREVFTANPLNVFLTLHRDALLDGVVSVSTLATALAWSVVSLLTGLAFFWRQESSYGRD